MKIGNVEIKGRTALAPMAGVTDRAFRELCVAFGAWMGWANISNVKSKRAGPKRNRSPARGRGDAGHETVEEFRHVDAQCDLGVFVGVLEP